jgi:YidC/Oxa1 family membrane protein insertase
MLSIAWNSLLVYPILNVLVGLYKITGSLGVSIIGLTIIIRAILLPVVLPSMRDMKKQRDLQPELEKIKKRFKYDKKKQAELQMELFKKHGINPASGCSTQLIMIIVLIALFTVIRRFALNVDILTINQHLYFDFLKFAASETLSTKFLYLDLSQKDPFFILAILSGILQYIASKMTIPYVEKAEKLAKGTPEKTDDFAYNMQEQMLYMMPAMNVIIGATLPAGVVLYIVVTTIFSVVQTYFSTGLGGLTPWIKKLKSAKTIE